MRPSIAGRHSKLRCVEAPVMVTRAGKMLFEDVTVYYPELKALALAFNKSKETRRMNILAEHVKNERHMAGEINTEDLDITVLDNK